MSKFLTVSYLAIYMSMDAIEEINRILQYRGICHGCNAV